MNHIVIIVIITLDDTSPNGWLDLRPSSKSNHVVPNPSWLNLCMGTVFPGESAAWTFPDTPSVRLPEFANASQTVKPLWRSSTSS
jgi:hypothetical protein